MIRVSVMELRAQIISFQRKTKTKTPVVPEGWYPDPEHFRYWINFTVKGGNKVREGGANHEEQMENLLDSANEVLVFSRKR